MVKRQRAWLLFFYVMLCLTITLNMGTILWAQRSGEDDASLASKVGNTHSVPAEALTVGLSDTTSDVLAPATGMTMSNYNITAGSDGDITVTNLTMTRTGTTVCDLQDFSNVYLYDGITRIGSGISSGLGNATFNNLNYNLPAGTTKALTVGVDSTSTSVTSGSFSIVDNNMIASAGALTVDLSGNTPASNALAPLTEINNMTIGSYRLTAGSNEDIIIDRLNVTAGQSGDVDLTNFRLYRENTLIGPGESTSASNPDTIFSSSNFTIDRAEDITVDVRADMAESQQDMRIEISEQEQRAQERQEQREESSSSNAEFCPVSGERIEHE